jgi:hypothetical protein
VIFICFFVFSLGYGGGYGELFEGESCASAAQFLYLIAKYLFREQHDRAIAKIWHKTMKKTPSLGSLRACEKHGA